MRKNADQNDSEYEYFSCSEVYLAYAYFFHLFQAEYVYKRYAYKIKHVTIVQFLSYMIVILHTCILHGNEYVTDFKKKAELFNSFFVKQCSLISNSSELPLNLHFTTEKHLDTLNFSNNDIEKIIQNLERL